jgi:3-methyladenine DNA glycosylase AlkD
VDTTALVAYVAAELATRADPAKAPRMAAYLKTDMPFYGVQKQGRTEVMRGVRRRFPITTRDDYRAAITALWDQPHREEKYLAVGIATRHREYLTFDELPLLRRLITEGAWWDFVDEVAARGVGHVLLHERELMGPELDVWIDDADMWIRRSALIAHLGHKERTDEEQLFTHCLKRAHEKEFFIRKAIGWALRQYARTAPEAVRTFALEHRDQLSGLTFREATKHLDVSELA